MAKLNRTTISEDTWERADIKEVSNGITLQYLLPEKWLYLITPYIKAYAPIPVKAQLDKKVNR